MAQNANTENSAPSSSHVDLPEYAKSFFLQLSAVTIVSFVPFVLYALLTLFVFAQIFIFGIFSFPQSDQGGLLNILYAPILVGLIIFFVALIRPFFFTRIEAVVHELSPEEYKNFHTFCNSLGKKLGVDSIDRMLVTNDVVVDVYYETPQDFLKRKLSLKIGLPLVPILTLKEFAALYFHEASRYHNEKIRRGYFFIRFMLYWCRVVANDEDLFARKINGAIEKFSLLRLLFFPLLISFSFVNKIFSGILALLETITRSTTDEIEYYADQVQANVGGNELFDHLLQHLVQIDQSNQRAIEQVLSGENVPSNMAELIVAHFKTSAVASGQFIEMAPAETFNSWYLMPPPNSRTRRLKKSTVNDNLSFDGDLKFLLKNTDAIGEGLSQAYYKSHDIKTGNFTTTMKAIDERKLPMSFPKEEEVLKRFTSGLYRKDAIWEFPQADKFSALPEDKIIPFLNKLVLTIRQNLPGLAKYVSFVDEYNKQSAKYHYAQWLIKDGSKTRVPADELDRIKLYKQDCEKQFEGKKESYRKSYGVRVAAATAMGKEIKAYPSALKLIKILSLLAQIQDGVNDAKIKVGTLELLIDLRAEGDDSHHNTIARLTKMVLKVTENMENVMKQIPGNLLGADVDVMEFALDLDLLNGADYEKRVADRFYELFRFYGGFNTVLSAKLAQFVEVVEKQKDIESVVLTTVKKQKTD